MGIEGALLASMGISATSNVVGGISNAVTMRGDALYSAEVAKANARLAEIQSEDALRRGEVAASRHRAETRQIVGSQRASYAAQGVDVGKGTPMEVQAETAALGELDAATIRMNAMKEAWGIRQQGLDYQRQAKMTRAAAKYGAHATLLTHGLQAAGDVAEGAYSYEYYKDQRARREKLGG